MITVGQLKDVLQDVPDDAEVWYTYDGPETFNYVEANAIIIEDGRVTITHDDIHLDKE